MQGTTHPEVDLHQKDPKKAVLCICVVICEPLLSPLGNKCAVGQLHAAQGLAGELLCAQRMTSWDIPHPCA